MTRDLQEAIDAIRDLQKRQETSPNGNGKGKISSDETIERLERARHRLRELDKVL